MSPWSLSSGSTMVSIIMSLAAAALSASLIPSADGPDVPGLGGTKRRVQQSWLDAMLCNNKQVLQQP